MIRYAARQVKVTHSCLSGKANLSSKVLKIQIVCLGCVTSASLNGKVPVVVRKNLSVEGFKMYFKSHARILYLHRVVSISE